KCRLSISTPNRRRRMSNYCVEHLFGYAAAKASSLKSMSPCVIGRQLRIADTELPNPTGYVLACFCIARLARIGRIVRSSRFIGFVVKQWALPACIREGNETLLD